jgi:hypothetical protein
LWREFLGIGYALEFFIRCKTLFKHDSGGNDWSCQWSAPDFIYAAYPAVFGPKSLLECSRHFGYF